MPVTISGSGTITGLAIGTTDLADAAVTTPKIADAAVTLGKMDNMATASVLGRNTAGTGAPEVLSAATTRTLIGADNASNLTTGTLPDARFPATLPAASGVNLTSLNASNLASGTVGTARLGSGTANNTTFLRGDGTWAVAGGDPTTTQVLNATAGASTGAVGTYGFMRNQSGSTVGVGGTVAGSSIQYSDTGLNLSQAASGTWRCMGLVPAGNATLFLRIS
jgi:hypothetical protein